MSDKKRAPSSEEALVYLTFIEMAAILRRAGDAVHDGKFKKAAQELSDMMDLGETVGIGLMSMEARKQGKTPEEICGCPRCLTKVKKGTEAKGVSQNN